jgi:hypothetical protein
MSDPQQTAHNSREEELLTQLAEIKAKRATELFALEESASESDQQLMQRLVRRDRRAKIRELLQDEQRLDKQREDVREELEALQLEEEKDEGELRLSVSRLEAKLSALSDRFDKELQQLRLDKDEELETKLLALLEQVKQERQQRQD